VKPCRASSQVLGVRICYLSVCLPLVLFLSCVAGPITPAAAQSRGVGPIPVFAYYYIWYEPASWDRAKTDYPLLGRYSSDDLAVMRTHVRLAKQAGIGGFIVSWKKTDVLNSRLEQLASIAGENNFELAVIYQGLDFVRDPLPASRVASDMEWFADRYEGNEAFLQFRDPIVIWSGTWEFSLKEVRRVAEQVGNRILLLASERDVEGYQRIDDFVDGDAYYWSSVDPVRTPGYRGKLREMSEVVHDDGGLWFAPAAPGFDSRLLGGARVIGRRNGATLRMQIAAAVRSSPDVLSIISWNEFSENSHIEPSRDHGREALDTLSDINAVSVPVPPGFDSDSPGRTGPGRSNVNTLFGLAVVLAASLGVMIARR
jgi:hypothetical protein